MSGGALYPREFFTLVYKPGGKLAEFVVRTSKEMTDEILQTVSAMNISLLGAVLSLEGVEGPYNLFLFLDFSQSKRTPADLKKVLLMKEGVNEVTYAVYEAPGILISRLGYPLMTGFGRCRLVAFGAESLSRAFGDIYDELGGGGGLLLYALGKRVGREMVETLEREARDVLRGEGLERLFLDFYQASGLGRIKVVEWGLPQREAIIRVYDNWESWAVRGLRDRPYCFFTRGIFAGMFTELYDMEIVADERKCIARGDSFCEFVLRKKP